MDVFLLISLKQKQAHLTFIRTCRGWRVSLRYKAIQLGFAPNSALPLK